MKLQSIKKGFTLIELLVVITIIGILATGATTVFTAQIQKARDTTRINDLKQIQSSVEQVYQDSSVYPASDSFGSGTSNVTGVTAYLDKIPSDPKNGQNCNGSTTCAYIYGVSVDDNDIEFGEYELSLGFENEANRTQKAADAKDNGNDPLRFEIGLDMDDGTNHQTASAGAKATVVAGTCWEIGGWTPAAVSAATQSIYLSDDCQ